MKKIFKRQRMEKVNILTGIGIFESKGKAVSMYSRSHKFNDIA